MQRYGTRQSEKDSHHSIFPIINKGESQKNYRFKPAFFVNAAIEKKREKKMFTKIQISRSIHVRTNDIDRRI
jgi:hypothetical protein